MEALIYPLVKLIIVGIVIVSVFAYFMHKIGDKARFTIAIKAIANMIVTIIGLIIILQLVKHIEKTAVDAINNVGKRNISSSSQNK